MADNFSEILALLAEQMRAADRDRARADQDREDNMRRFERLTEVMITGFGRLEDKIDGVKQELTGTNQRLDHLTERVDHLTERVDHLTERVDNLTDRVDHLTERVDNLTDRVDHLTERVDTLTDEQRTINRRLQATFGQTGELTEKVTDVDMRLTRTEQIVPTNAELDARLREVENRLRDAS